jgi:hypothetical protein
VTEESTGNTKYKILNVQDTNAAPIFSTKHILLRASENSTFEYTEKNKWHIPMFVIKGYQFDFD